MLLLGIWLSEKKTWQNLTFYVRQPKVALMIGMFAILGLRQIFAPEPLISLLQWSNFGLVGLFALFLRLNSSQFRSRATIAAVAATVLFQSVVGLAQFQLQHEVAGYLFLGEPELSRPIGIAHTIITGQETLLPYGTTAHPNVLAGFLAMYCLWLLKTVREERLWWLLIPCTLGIVTLVLTTSVSGLLTFGFGLSGLFLARFVHISEQQKKLLVGLILIVTPLVIHLLALTAPKNLSVVRRDYLQQAGLRIFANQPLLGSGLQSVTRYVEANSSASEVVRFTQPPHHVGVVLLAEAGLLGLFVALTLVKRAPISSWLILVPIISLDHYLWTIWPGSVLTILCLLNLRSESPPH